MMHPHTELKFVSPAIGHGVFATRFIPQGTVTWVRDPLDMTFTGGELARLDPLYREYLQKYTFVDAASRFVLCWDHARFVNHSCDANCFSAGYDFEFAIRDIQAGEELTDDYGTLNLRDPFRCACDSERCRGEVFPDDMVRLRNSWDERVREVFPRVGRVPQPLWPMLREKRDVEAALRDPEKLRSVFCNYSPLAPVEAVSGEVPVERQPEPEIAKLTS